MFQQAWYHTPSCRNRYPRATKQILFHKGEETVSTQFSSLRIRAASLIRLVSRTLTRTSKLVGLVDDMGIRKPRRATTGRRVPEHTLAARSSVPDDLPLLRRCRIPSNDATEQVQRKAELGIGGGIRWCWLRGCRCERDHHVGQGTDVGELTAIRVRRSKSRCRAFQRARSRKVHRCN